MRIEKVYFKAEDGLELFGLIHTSENKDDKSVVISTHGMGSNCLKKRDDVIARKLTENNIAYFTYNNRGSEYVNTLYKEKEKVLEGTVFEDVLESYYDIVAAIKQMKEMGYENIHLLGHSLGATKTLYTHNQLIKNNEEDILNSIKSVLLLSLVDLSDVMKYVDKSNEDVDVPSIAYEKEKQNYGEYIIETKTAFMPLVSAKTFLRYYRDNVEIDFARYTDDTFEFKTLNRIRVPLFMRWGNVNELINLSADELVNKLNEKVRNENKDIGYIDGATHNYIGKEEELAGQILNFLMK